MITVLHCVAKRKEAVAKIFLKKEKQTKTKNDISISVNNKLASEYFYGRFLSVITFSFESIKSLLLVIEKGENIEQYLKDSKFSESDKDYISATSSEKARELLEKITGLSLEVKVSGGGISAQSDAVKFGISRMISLISSDFIKFLRMFGFLTRDTRIVERKKAGRRKARKKEQYSKR